MSSTVELVEWEQVVDAVHPGTHDEFVAQVANTSIPCEIAGDCFASSFAPERRPWRSLLAAVARTHLLEEHSFEPYLETSACKTCGYYNTTKSMLAKQRLRARVKSQHSTMRVHKDFPSLGIASAYPLLFLFKRSEVRASPPLDYSRFEAILAAIEAAPANTTAATLEKVLRGVVRAKERRGVIESLGVAGILRPKGYPSRVEEHITLAEISARSKFNTDFSYPVQHWRGADGIHADAVRYWFPAMDWT